MPEADAVTDLDTDPDTDPATDPDGALAPPGARRRRRWSRRRRALVAVLGGAAVLAAGSAASRSASEPQPLTAEQRDLAVHEAMREVRAYSRISEALADFGACTAAGGLDLETPQDLDELYWLGTGVTAEQLAASERCRTTYERVHAQVQDELDRAQASVPPLAPEGDRA